MVSVMVSAGPSLAVDTPFDALGVVFYLLLLGHPMRWGILCSIMQIAQPSSFSFSKIERATLLRPCNHITWHPHRRRSRARKKPRTTLVL